MSKKSEEPKTMAALHPWKALFYVSGDKRFPVVLGKGGELSAPVAFAGHDMRTSPDHEIYASSCSRVNLLAEYANEEGFFFHDDMTTAPAEFLRAPWFMKRNEEVMRTKNEKATNIVNLIANKREKRHSRLVEPVIFETISYQPSKLQLKWIKKFLFGSPKQKKSQTNVDRVLSEFNERVNNLVDKLSERIGKAKRLNADQLYSYYYYTLTGLWVDIEAPKESGSPFGTIMNVQRNDDELGNTFSVRAINKNVHIRVVTMYGMPDMIRPEFFENLCFLGEGIRWSSRIKIVPSNKIRKAYTEQWIRYNSSTYEWRQQMQQKMGGAGVQDPVQVELARQAHDDVKGTKGAKFGAYLVSSIIVYRTNEEDAEKQASRIASYLIDMKKLCTVEEVGTKVAMAATLPGNPEYNLSSDLLPDFPVVTCLPCSIPYTGPDERGGMSSLKASVAWQFTIKNTFPARVDLGNGQNRHVAILAPIRTGKSTLLQLVIAFMLANMKNPFVYLLDVDVDKSASRIAATAMGGKVLSFARGTAAIQPFRDIHDPERRKTAMQWVKQCIRAHGLDDRIPKIHKRAEEAFDLMATIPHEYRTVEQFQAIVQDFTIKACLNVFACGEYASHVGGNKNEIGVPPYVVIDCTGLMGTGKASDPLAACVVSALVDEITFTVGHHKGPVQLCIDEAVQVFPLIGESIDAAYKRWPKQGGGITIVLHDPKDLNQIGITGDIITQNTGSWICLSDPNATENKAYEGRVKLSEFQCALISEMKQGDFLIKDSATVRVLQTDLSKLERWVLGQGGKEAMELAEKLDITSTSVDTYSINLLREGGFNDEAKEIEECCTRNVVDLYSIAAE